MKKQKMCAPYRDDLKKAVEQTSSCKSNCSCLKGERTCKALGPLTATAGFVAPTSSVEGCSYCVPAYRGFVCFCPTRWALFRSEPAPG